ncbi:S8 family peptidase [Alcaligenes sp. CHO6]|uniref:S8 family peptidase n=1 Tax=Alcaligenes sp. CHO6 TaxID=3123298 RepID=UPI0030150728
MPTNIILGYGETLTNNHKLKRSSGPKKYPYGIQEQRRWLGGQLVILKDSIQKIPRAAKPRGETVAKFTLHPAFLAKTHHPNSLLMASGLRCIGSRSTYIHPRRVNIAGMSKTDPIYTATLYVTGADESFSRFSAMLESPRTAKTHQEAFCRFESIQPFTAAEKNFLANQSMEPATLEVALHANKNDIDIIEAFSNYVESLGGTAYLDRALNISGLTFLPISIAPTLAEDIATFQFVRAVRAMPSLRVGGRAMRISATPVPALPLLPALDQSLSVGVFDGGLGHTDFSRWATETIMPGTEHTTSDYLTHGNSVTSALLFGPLEENQNSFPRPYANVQHYRCISPDLQTQDNVPDLDLYQVLKHINEILESKKLDFINFSIGPYTPLDDDEVHPWSALIDKHLASGQTFATVAVGNTGEEEWPECRIQPPSDMVNAVAVGACDNVESTWQRAPYSSYGPGRRPGLVKPDGVAFGGSDSHPFVVYNALSNQLVHTSGTSFSAPTVLRTAIGVKASLNSPLSMLAVKALMTHHATRPVDILMSHSGHGRFPQNIDEVLICEDNEVRVIYQGTLTAGQNLRAFIPFPSLPLKGRVTLSATLCFASQTDPEHAVNYTRAGLTVHLRPRKSSTKTASFFSAGKMYTSELEARTDDQKWETTLKHEHRFNATTLDDPMFDITYGAREEGMSVNNSSLPPLPYAMVVSVIVENTPGVYNNIRQRYQTLQPVEVRQEVSLKAK